MEGEFKGLTDACLTPSPHPHTQKLDSSTYVLAHCGLTCGLGHWSSPHHAGSYWGHWKTVYSNPKEAKLLGIDLFTDASTKKSTLKTDWLGGWMMKRIKQRKGVFNYNQLTSTYIKENNYILFFLFWNFGHLKKGRVHIIIVLEV